MIKLIIKLIEKARWRKMEKEISRASRVVKLIDLAMIKNRVTRESRRHFWRDFIKTALHEGIL